MTTSPDDYALSLADISYEWYRSHAVWSRKLYKTSEVSLLLVSAAIPVSAAVSPHNAITAAVLGAVVVVLAGFRSVFHWQDNFLRFSGAREEIEAERRRYTLRAAPYDGANRQAVLAEAVTRIEADEMRGWVKVAASRPKP